MAGQEAVHSINGPMANSLRDLSLFARAVIGSEPWRWDPKCVPMPWAPVSLDSERGASSRKLRIGLLIDDGIVEPTPPVQRVLREVAQKLMAAGHEVVEWHATPGFGSASAASAGTNGNGNGAAVQANEFEQGMAILQAFFLADGRKGIARLLKAGGELSVPGLPLPSESELSINESWEWQAKRTTWAAEMLKKWHSLAPSSQSANGASADRSSTNRGPPLDALLAPATPYAGVTHGDFAWVGYTGVWNLMDMPGVILPVDTANAQRDTSDEYVKAQARNEYDAKVRETCECM